MAHPNSIKVVHVVKKGPWSQVEDEMLVHLVATYGPEQWMEISKDHGSRNAKQCRERYHQNLKPTINRGPITAEEGVAIERLHAEKGPKWAEISRALGGRSDNQVKNWYNGQKNRRTKMHAHNGQQVNLQGTQHSLSAVKPVDAQMLQQRGHMNPYSHGSAGRHQNCRPSPTTSQISEAPSLISDASSTSPGISPSSNIAYPACTNAWSMPEEPNRSNIPSFHHLPTLQPNNTAPTGLFRQTVNSQAAHSATWELEKSSVVQSPDLFSQHNHLSCETQSHFHRSHPPESRTGRLPPVHTILSAQEDHFSSKARTFHAPPAARSPPGLNRLTLPRLHSDQGGERLRKPIRPYAQASSVRNLRACFRHEPYPLSRNPAIAAAVTAPGNTTKCRMSLANVLE
ncbi:MAG: hypothetical protein Q9195_000994 [Heterodermia aff. obscurata]